MDNKTCSRCGESKPRTQEFFFRKKSSRDGWCELCKPCKKAYMSTYRKEHADDLKQYKKQYNQEHQEQRKKYSRDYHAANKESSNKKSRQYWARNKDEWTARYSESNKKYYRRNRERIIAQNKAYKKKNRFKTNKWHVDRRKNNDSLRVAHNLRTRICIALKSAGASKVSKTFDLVGCSKEDFKKHLESKFLPGMSWANYGRDKVTGLYGWEIDHIIPCACFDLTKEEDQRKCFHFSNMQPLWRKDNAAKNHSYNGVGFRKNSFNKTVDTQHSP